MQHKANGQAFEDTGSVVDRRKGSGRKQLIYETKLEVLKMKKKLQSVHPYNCTSVRKIANQPSVSVSHTTVHRILQSESFYPYKPVQVPKLFASDLEMRLKFVKQWEALGINLSDVLWTDEAKFDLHCNVRSLHGSIWSDKKPIQHIGKPLYSPNLSVWVGFTSKFAIPSYFFESTVTGESYNIMLNEHVIPFIKSKRKLSKTWMQQDGASPHIFGKVKKTLSTNFKNRLISRGFEFPWPARSPDLNPLDYFYWGFVKSQLYNKTSYTSTTQLKTELINIIKNIDQEILEKAKEAQTPFSISDVVEMVKLMPDFFAQAEDQ